ncbi:MAG: phosphatidate cytidylyltransferase [Thermoplasmata archaeon]|nr:MAG: phosphatidate cytidylyltransferase [Thermoplasmata archaeon]RLF33277.1 MAG: phosphatidate cytidylyltransferase [Thermoplasmata archaeon]
MVSGDIAGLITVYVYVIILLFLSEKVLKKYPLISRKFLHIMVGNIFFILPLFDHAWVMAFVAAAPFIVLTFLVSPHSPLKLVSGTSAAGHGMGLVYYAISWTILAYVFFDRPEVIAVGIVAMSYGDGFASLVGSRYGKRKYDICGDVKSVEGSLAMMVMTVIVSAVALIYYGAPISIPVIGIVAVASAVVEALTPMGLDNLSVSLSAAFLYYALTYGV